jgi:multicomponent Na+:H+ antiporter subunit G
MALFADIVSWSLILAGGAFLVIGAIGLVRLPDVFSAFHAAGLIDTLGIICLFLGLIVQAGFGLVSIKLALILGFLFFTSPIAAHALAQAALGDGLRPELTSRDQGEPPSTT